MRRALAIVVMAAALATFSAAQEGSGSSGINAGRVDGLHAVRYTTSPGTRNGKLVGANSSDYLPNNIIRKADDANKLDGLDSTAYAKVSELTMETTTVGYTAENTIFGPGTHVLRVGCPTGWARTGGGYGFADTGDTTEYAVVSSIPAGNDSWEVHFEVVRSTTLRVMVVCARVTS